MNNLTNILIGFLILSSYSLFGQLGRAVISYQPIYEDENNFFPHDHFLTVVMDGLLDTAVFIQKTKQGIDIKNMYNDGFTGHSIQFRISPSLEIEDVKYQEWTDVIDGSEIRYTVEKAILSMNENPFKEELITGHYTLQIKAEYFAGKLLSKEGMKDTTTYRVFHGKFKLYSEKEKRKGREWTIDQNEIKAGVKDSLGIYELPQFDPKFCYGADSLNKYLETTVRKHLPEKDIPTKYYFRFLINEAGRVEEVKMESQESFDDNIVERIEKEISESCWIPAINYGKTVKSTIYPRIEIK